MYGLRAIGGITTMKCDECGFEFVFVEPEETEEAAQIMVDHAEMKHQQINIQITTFNH